MNSVRSQAFFIFIAGIALFTVGLSHQEVIGFESRFFLFAQEMWRHGPTWFPTTYQQPYPDYPGTSTYFIYLFSKLIGGVTKFSAIFPSAVAAAVTLSVTYLIGALHSRHWGFASALFLLFTITFVTEARTISLDQYTTAITATCFYLIYSAQFLQHPKRIAWIFPLFILGFAFRGPVGLIIPTAVVCTFYLLDKDFKRFFIVALLSGLLLVLCCTLLLGLADQAGGAAFKHEVLLKEVLGRMQHDAQTPGATFYFVESFGAYAISYPLAIAVILGLSSQFTFSKATKMLWKVLGWALVILIGLSIPADKKVRYILPAAPALALLCGYLFFVAKEKRYFYILRKLFILFCWLFPILCLSTVLILHSRHPNFSFSLAPIIWTLALSQFAMLLVTYRPLFVFSVAVLAFIACNVLVIEPINIELNKTREFVLQVEKLRQEQDAKLAFYQEGIDGLAIKYLVNTPSETQPLFLQKPEELQKVKKDTLIVVTEENFQKMPKKLVRKRVVILHGQLGREPVVVFQMRKR